MDNTTGGLTMVSLGDVAKRLEQYRDTFVERDGTVIDRASAARMMAGDILWPVQGDGIQPFRTCAVTTDGIEFTLCPHYVIEWAELTRCARDARHAVGWVRHLACKTWMRSFTHAHDGDVEPMADFAEALCWALENVSVMGGRRLTGDQARKRLEDVSRRTKEQNTEDRNRRS